MKRVLITGAGGFIGQKVISQLLHSDYEIHVLTYRSKFQDKKIHQHVVDLFNNEHVNHILSDISVDHLLHLAWYTEPNQYWNSLENFSWVSASLNLIHSFIEHGGERLIVAGSCAEYDWSHSDLISEQTTPRAMSSPYTICKNSLYTMLDSMARETAINFTWGRIFFPYGPGERKEKLIPSAIHALMNNMQFSCEAPELVRDYIFVEDVAAAFIQLMDVNVNGPINIASGEPVRLGTLVNRIADMMGKPSSLVRENTTSDHNCVVADVSKLNHDLGFHPSVKLEQGLQKSIDWWTKKYASTANA